MKGTPYYDMARDAGYKGDEAEQMAAALEADHRKLMQLQEPQMSAAEEIERLGQIAARAQMAYDRALKVEKDAIEARRGAYEAWENARTNLDQSVHAFVQSKVSSEVS